MMRKLFETWPRGVAGVAIAGFLASVLIVLCFGAFTNAGVLLPKDDDIGYFYFATVLFSVASVIYGCTRVLHTHPALDPAYLRWLEATPFNGSQPLPKGPVGIGWGDVFFVAIAAGYCALSEYAGVRTGLAPLICLVLPYTILLAFCHKLTGDTARAGLLAFSLPVVLQFHTSYVLLAILLPSIAAIANRLAKKQLREFPWATYKTHEAAELTGRKLDKNEQGRGENYWVMGEGSEVGWPLGSLTPTGQWRTLSYPASFLIAVWAAWTIVGVLPLVSVVFSFSIEIDDRLLRDCARFGFGIAVVGALVRFGIYAKDTRPPVSLAARLRTGKLIVPSYHRVHVAGIVAMAVGYATPYLLQRLTHSLPWIAGLTVGAVVLVLLSIGPRHKQWLLTGNHRLGRGFLLDPQATGARR